MATAPWLPLILALVSDVHILSMSEPMVPIPGEPKKRVVCEQVISWKLILILQL